MDKNFATEKKINDVKKKKLRQYLRSNERRVCVL